MAVCVPIAAYWDRGVMRAGAVCLDQNALFLCDLTLALVTDSAILLLPIPLTWSLQMSRWHKVRISMTLGLGGMATAAVSYRIYWILESAHSKDITYDFTIQNLFVMIELMIGEVCACLPSAVILCKKCWTKSSKPPRFWTDSAILVRSNHQRHVHRASTFILMSTVASNRLRAPSIEPVSILNMYCVSGNRTGSAFDGGFPRQPAQGLHTTSPFGGRSQVSGPRMVQSADLRGMGIRRTTEVYMEVSHAQGASQNLPTDYRWEDV